MNDLVAISGGFDPLHVGHLNLIEEAAEHGRVVVILNSDAWLKRKKSFIFMPYEDRCRLLLALRDVHNVIPASDEDGTVCETLRHLKPSYFANGGDRRAENTPELKLCLDLGIKPLWGVGGAKIASSSELVKSAYSEEEYVFDW